MKKQIIIALSLLLISIFSFSQVSKPQAKAEKEFLKQLNAIIQQKNISHHWLYEDPFEMVQPFRIDSNMLSVTIRYRTDSAWFLHRMIMPVSSIKGIAWDIYIIVESQANDVLVYESETNTPILKLVANRSIFHVGQADDEITFEKLKKSWENLASYYHTSGTTE